MTTVEILRAAKAELERRGFCQGDFTNDKGCCCLLGACWYALGASFRKVPGGRRQWQVVYGGNSFPAGVTNVLDRAVGEACHEWNDRPETDLPAALAAFDAAIALAEASTP